MKSVLAAAIVSAAACFVHDASGAGGGRSPPAAAGNSAVLPARRDRSAGGPSSMRLCSHSWSSHREVSRTRGSSSTWTMGGEAVGPVSRTEVVVLSAFAHSLTCSAAHPPAVPRCSACRRFPPYGPRPLALLGQLRFFDGTIARTADHLATGYAHRRRDQGGINDDTGSRRNLAYDELIPRASSRSRFPHSPPPSRS